MRSAEEAIRNLLGRYCELMDAGDFTGLGALLANAELLDERGRVFARGAADVEAQWRARTILYGDSPRTQHLVSNTQIEVDESTGLATANSAYVVFQAVDAHPLQPIVSGRYADRFRQESGTWEFSSRRFTVDLTGDLSRHLRDPSLS